MYVFPSLLFSQSAEEILTTNQSLVNLQEKAKKATISREGKGREIHKPGRLQSRLPTWLHKPDSILTGLPDNVVNNADYEKHGQPEKLSPHTQKKQLCEVMDMLKLYCGNHFAIICRSSNHYIVHLKLTQCYVNYVSTKLGRKKQSSVEGMRWRKEQNALFFERGM